MFSFSTFTHNYTKSVYKHIEPVSEDYRVFVNGMEIPVYTCRISKYPFNRVWPGYQRSIDQTVPASFVNIVSDEETKVEVICQNPYETVRIKPYSKNIVPSERDGRICFTLPENGQFVLHTGNHHHCLYIFNSAPIECPDKSSVTHYFGPGIHFPGKVTLNDNESIYVDKDALVFGCIYAENAKNIHVFGNGIFDDTSEGRINNQAYEAFTNGNIKFYDCENVRVEGVLFRNSAFWCVNIFHCTDVVLDNIKVFGQWRYNTDGVDIVNSRDITLKNSFIHSFDDTVTIKGIDRYLETGNENILTENCVLWCDWGRCCEIGIETACPRYKNIVFRNCDVLKGGLVALDIQNGDCAEISDVIYENINVEYNAFDTPEEYQHTDDTKYASEDKISIPYLINISNRRFRTPENRISWGLPAEIPPMEGIQSGGVHDVIFRNINVYYDEAIPKPEGKYHIPIRLKSSVEGVEYYNINISDITVNGEKADETNITTHEIPTWIDL